MKTILLLITTLCCFSFTWSADYRQELAEVQAGTRQDARLEWWGFNPTDSTAILEKALASGVARLTIGKQAAPWILSRTVKLRSNLELIFEDGAEILAKPGSFKGITEMLLYAVNCRNLTLRGPGILTMQKADYQNPQHYQHAEWRHTLAVVNSSDIRIEGLTFRNSGGDGIYLNNVKDTIVDRVICDNNLRQGISIISAENLLIKNSRFSRTSGAAPEAGIDFEPNRWDEKLINCVIENCEFIGNRQCGLLFALPMLTAKSAPVSITIRNCRLEQNGKGVYFLNLNNNAVTGKINLENCQITGSRDFTVHCNGQAATGYAVTMTDCLLDNRHAKSRDAILLSGGRVTVPLGNLHFNRVKVIDPAPNAQAFRFTGWELHRLRNLSGSLTGPDGQAVSMQDFLKRSAAQAISETRSVKLESLKPMGQKSIQASAQPIRARFSGTFLQYARQGETIRLTGILFPLGRKNPATVTIVSPGGKTVGTQSIPVGPDTVITFQAAETGLYQLQYNTVGQGLTLLSSHPGNGYLANDAWKLIASTGRLYFRVPAGTSTVAVRLSGGDDKTELVDADLLSPDGKVISSARNIFIPKLLSSRRINPNLPEIWSVRINRSVDDFTISILGDATPILADSPEKLFEEVR